MHSTDLVLRALEPLLAMPRPGAPLAGICGPQGSGKSTLAADAAQRLEGQGVRTAVLSLDDFYLSRARRAALAATVHPLLRTRGVPLTHDVPLAAATLDSLRRGAPTALPAFDKAADEPADRAAWRIQPAGTRIVLLEGWCVGARPQPPHELASPVNTLEAAEDADGRWRRAVNAALAGPYAALFARLDLTILLRAPDFAQVFGWRRQQEDALRRARAAAGLPPARTMDDPALLRFIAHYERLTRHIHQSMPAHADLVIDLDAGRRPVRAAGRAAN